MSTDRNMPTQPLEALCLALTPPLNKGSGLIQIDTTILRSGIIDFSNRLRALEDKAGIAHCAVPDPWQ